MYTQKAGLIFGGNLVKDKPHGLLLCWVACGGLLWRPRMIRLLSLALLQLYCLHHIRGRSP
jgi:hypothetical protein